ncbi:MAG: DNA (cytosine-5-)-methyltransferase [Rikenellaceae bacterium]
MSKNKIRFIDIFAGIGGIRLGFEQAAKELGVETECVLTSEIKSHAIEVLKQNHPDEDILGDITNISSSMIPDFDILLGGFPCQAFSAAGKRHGFSDTRGTLFFEVQRILKEKSPYGFILENVEGLINHEKESKNDKIGKTLKTILNALDELGYNVEWKVLNSRYFGVAQERKRVYIVGTKSAKPSLDSFVYKEVFLKDVIESGKTTIKSRFIDLLTSHYTPEELYGKSLKDKRGGDNNIHSWDIELKGAVSKEQRTLLNQLFKERRKKRWAEEFKIDWMDGMPLTLSQIRTFYDRPNLEFLLEDLTEKGYLKKEHPKKLVDQIDVFGVTKRVRIQDSTLPLGYNIVTGKLSFEVSKILDPNDVVPTLVAMDMKKLFVIDGEGLRAITHCEGLKLFGYPEDFKFNISNDLGYDLLGNTVVVPVVKEVAKKVLNIYVKNIVEV